jgi:hypothetical protein
MSKPTVINLYGGPSSGKSTQGAGLFYRMKQSGYNVELVNEFAKEVVWEGNVPLLRDQLYVLAHQHRKLVRLANKVDYIITDSPVLLSIAYRGLYDGPMYSDLIDKLALECYDMYNNINFMLARPQDFQTTGRAQDYEQSLKIDSSIVSIFQQYNIQYRTLSVNHNTVDQMLQEI